MKQLYVLFSKQQKTKFDLNNLEIKKKMWLYLVWYKLIIGLNFKLFAIVYDNIDSVDP